MGISGSFAGFRLAHPLAFHFGRADL